MKGIKVSLPLVLMIALLSLGGLAMTYFVKMEDAVVERANVFLASLSDKQQEAATFAFEDSSRTQWHFLPLMSYDRKGVSLGELTDEQDEKLFAMLEASLSAEGYDKTQKIIDLENILKVLEANNPSRDPEQYHIAFYGTPVAKGTWGFSFQGHHVALQYTFVDGKLSAAPTFLGANPAEVPSGEKKGLRVLKDEEDLGIQLVNALTREQQAMALITANAPREIFTANASEVKALEQIGVTFAQLSKDNQKLLKKIIEEYVAIMPHEIAEIRWSKLTKAGMDQIRFAWAGPMDRTAGHYYRVQGPTFLIEFDNTQNNANHIHTVWRDFDGDFGRDLLREHYHGADGKHGHD